MKAIVNLCITILLWSITSCKQTAAIMFYKSHEPQKKHLPFSDVVAANGFLFLSGQIGMDHTTRKIVKGGIKEETRQAIENIKAVLRHHNKTLGNVVKCTVILADINDFKAFNEVYATYFNDKPARTTFAAYLAAGAKVEIEALAVK